MIEIERVQQLLVGFTRLRIGLVGDLFLDRYLELVPDVCELSIETGLEAYQIQSVRNSPGALGTVMNNLTALGVSELAPATVIGDDGHGYDLLRELARLPVATEHILQDPNRLTPTYTKPLRPVGNGWQELNRLDVRSRGPISPATVNELASRLRRVFEQTDGLIVLDQIADEDAGVIHAKIRDLLSELAQTIPHKLILVDSRTRLHKFSCGTLKGNRGEVMAASGRSIPSLDGADDQHSVEQGAITLAQRTGRTAYLTDGDRGSLAATADGTLFHAPPYHIEGPIDIVGAGDSATSAIVCSLLCGANPQEAAIMGNLSASITIQQLGTTGTASPKQIEERAQKYIAQI